ncbi:hypothetical protein [Metabacillus malikii]|uniref:Cytosolic protein n=1 Tax=Metabacillus malikii TaxID=1504265 RepID=A0ABT9ZAN0_9BACI|nr:hypothetical protein [Metabacillus malikii]MDQ0229298.1 hypothetical protein [Metabacillus malikii]
MLNNDEEYRDFSNVETGRDFLTAEEFPDGPFGSPIRKNEKVENKSTPWQEGQQYYSNFAYENRTLHEDLQRQFPHSHPTHDDKSKKTDKRYEDS